MKKFLALFLALLMCVGVFAGCGTKTDDSAVTLEQAKDYLYNIMKNKNGMATPNDYEVVGMIKIEETTFEVTWTTDNEDIKVKESTKENMWTIDLPDVNAEEIEYTITATIKAADGSTIEVSFTPKLPVIDNTGVTTTPEENKAYKIFFEQKNLGYTLYALNTTQNGENKFINATIDPKEAADFYMEAVEDGYKIYTMIDGVKNYIHAATVAGSDGKVSKYIGFATETDSVFVYDSDKGVYTVTINGSVYGVGTYQSYETICLSDISYFKPENINVAGKNGQFPIGFMESEYAETLAPDEKPVYQDPAADSTLTIAQAIALGETRSMNQYTTNKYYVTGTITAVQNDTYGNIVISDGTNEILVYGTYDATGANRYDAMATKPGVGDEVTVYGVVGMYNDAQIKNAWIVAINGNSTVTPPAGGGDAPTNTYAVVDTPVAGTAYKFGMVQQNVQNKVFYLAGGMAQTYYLATTDNGDAGIDVYLEETTGGYYLYTMVGTTKTYINMVVSGTHVNGAYEATASTVYTYDATNKTIIANVTVEADTTKSGDYWFGTRNDNTYTTVGPCAVSYAGFYCQFYAVADGDVTPPAGGDDDGGDVTPPAGGDDDGGDVTPPAGATLVDATITDAIPAELTYITNNPQYPNPSFYSAGGLKMNYVNMGVQTATFAAQSSVKVTIKVAALNANTKSGNDADVFTVYGLDASGNTVVTATYDAVVAGDNVVLLEGEGIVAVKVIMTDYAHNGSAFCNISLGGVKVEGN